MKLVIVYGTRPEYLKVLPLIHSIPCTVIRIMQHGDILEDTLYNSCITIVESSKNRLDSLGSQILEKLNPVLQDCTHVLVQGDTATTFYSALCAFQNKKKVIHLEAGMRTYSLTDPYPEEGYRQMISRITNIHLCPHEVNAQILRNEHVSGDIHVVGNTILDVVKTYKLRPRQGKTVLITFHRRENLEFLDVFIEQLRELVVKFPNNQFVWIMHPNKDLQHRIKESNINCELIDPCNHHEFLNKVESCFCVLTDSGGIQEECAFLGKPTIVLRKSTERDQIKEPYLYVVQPPYATLKTVFESLPNNQLDPCYVYGDGNSATNISKILNNGVSQI